MRVGCGNDARKRSFVVEQQRAGIRYRTHLIGMMRSINAVDLRDEPEFQASAGSRQVKRGGVERCSFWRNPTAPRKR